MCLHKSMCQWKWLKYVWERIEQVDNALSFLTMGLLMSKSVLILDQSAYLASSSKAWFENVCVCVCRSWRCMPGSTAINWQKMDVCTSCQGRSNEKVEAWRQLASRYMGFAPDTPSTNISLYCRPKTSACALLVWGRTLKLLYRSTACLRNTQVG